MADPVADLTGTTVGRFTVRVRLGAGGMGEVYRADDTKLKRSVALKRMAPHLRADARYRQRFLKEAERASRLTDQHIAGLYDVLEEGGETFLVMEYVEGETLRQRLARPLPIEEFLAIAGQCAEALVAAHQKDIVHRDLKPENIMLTPAGQVKVLDFGVAKRLPRPDETADTAGLDSVRSTAGGLSGTPAYMAPETLLEKEADGRADIFSLGVVFYEALTGRHPFRAASFVATSDRILRESPAPLLELNPRVPAELERIVAKMLAKRPDQRYQTAADLLVDLRALQRPVPPRPEPRAAPRWWQRRTRTQRTSLVTTLVAAAAVLGWYSWLRQPAFAERDWVLVADFENRTAEPLFDQTVSELLRQALQQSRYVNVVPRDRVVEAAQRLGRGSLARVEATTGREICLRDNFRALLTGQITSLASGYQVTVQVVDPHDGVAVLSDSEVLRSIADLHAGVQRLARRLRRNLGESLAQIEKDSRPLAEATTPSLVALQRYTSALDFYVRGDLDGFFALANSAVELDPDFAMAHLYLARAHFRKGNLTAAGEHLARARQGLERVTERERHLILALDYQVQDFYQEAADEYRLLSELYPDDVEGHRGLAEVSLWIGRREQAIPAQRRVLELNPHSAVDHGRLVLYLNRANRFQEALEASAAAHRLGLDSTQLRWGTGLAYLAQDNVAAARRQFEQLRQSGGNYEENLGSLYLARVLIYEGRLREAADMLRAGLLLDERMGSESWVPVRRGLLAHVELLRGRRAAAAAEARWLAASARARAHPGNLCGAGLLAVELGDLASARSLLKRLEELAGQQASAFTKSCSYHLKGELERAQSQLDAAVESQQAAAAYFTDAGPFLALARTYQAARDWPAAIRAYKRAFEFKGELFQDASPADWVLAQLELARLHAQAGDREQARRHYDEFLRLWARADADLPVLEQARAERGQLVAAAPAN